VCNSDDFAAVKERIAKFMAAGFIALCAPKEPPAHPRRKPARS
jgi:hypothetical protein